MSNERFFITGRDSQTEFSTLQDAMQAFVADPTKAAQSIMEMTDGKDDKRFTLISYKWIHDGSTHAYVYKVPELESYHAVLRLPLMTDEERNTEEIDARYAVMAYPDKQRAFLNKAEAGWNDFNESLRKKLAALKQPQPQLESPESQFAKAIKDAGLELNGLPIMDGLLHRVPVASDKGSERSGAYVGHLEGRKPGGYIQNFKTGEVVNWKADGSTPELTPAERARIAIESAQRRREGAAVKAEKNANAAAAAQALWKESPVASAANINTANAYSANAYCLTKRILHPDASGLRIVPPSVSPECAALGIKIVQSSTEAQVARKADPEAKVFVAGNLLVAGRDTSDKIWTLQSIGLYFKSFMKGGQKYGMFSVAGTEDPKKALNSTAPLIVCEGFATADTVSRLLGQPVIVAFDSGNLDPVIGELRKNSPDRPILIAADNDYRAETNVGLLKANEAAVKHGCGVMAPSFKDGELASDWNDLAAITGDAVAKRIIGDSMIRAKIEADGNLATIKANRTIDAEKGMLATLKKTVATEFARHFKPRELNKQHVPTKNASQERGGFEI